MININLILEYSTKKVEKHIYEYGHYPQRWLNWGRTILLLHSCLFGGGLL